LQAHFRAALLHGCDKSSRANLSCHDRQEDRIDELIGPSPARSRTASS
jgi:hypothetical protein